MTTNQTIDGVSRVLLNADREMRVYIAGPMTGIADYNFPAFNAMADKMRAAGWHVENPADHGLVDGAGWADYLRYDIGCLASCETIMLLPGWTASRGARLEVSIAKELGVVFMFADGAEREQAAQPQGDSPTNAALIRDLTGVIEQQAALIASLRAEQPAPVAVVLPDQLIAAIEAEQARLSEEDYLMDSGDCVNVIREEVARRNAEGHIHLQPRSERTKELRQRGHQCLACGALHPGSRNLPCPKMIPTA